MFKFLKHLFKRRKKRLEDEVDVDVDMNNGVMTIMADRKLTEKEIMELFKKHVLGE